MTRAAASCLCRPLANGSAGKQISTARTRQCPSKSANTAADSRPLLAVALTLSVRRSLPGVGIYCCTSRREIRGCHRSKSSHVTNYSLTGQYFPSFKHHASRDPPSNQKGYAHRCQLDVSKQQTELSDAVRIVHVCRSLAISPEQIHARTTTELCRPALRTLLQIGDGGLAVPDNRGS